MERFKVAAIQAAPVFLDRTKTVQKAAALVRQAAKQGARLIAFPEAFVPAYPVWVWMLRPSDYDQVVALHAELSDQSVDLSADHLAPLQEAAREAEVTVGIGINERVSTGGGGTLYNSYVILGPTGAVLGVRRKLIPTAPERMVWGMADGSTLRTTQTDVARVGCLICWENYMPLTRYALYADGTKVILSPTWDEGEVWQASMRHIAKEARAYVVSCSPAMRVGDIPERFAFRSALGGGEEEWFKSGGSMIVDPTGAIVAGPLNDDEGIVYAECKPEVLRGQKWNLDVCGHYSRPDLFRLHVDRSERRTVVEGELRGG